MDKRTTARRLIHSAIRLAVLQEDPLATHVLIVSAHNLMRQYAASKEIPLMNDVISQVHPSFTKEVADALNKLYNFLRHSDRDPDATIDISQIEPFTDAFIAITAQMYVELFHEDTTHMRLFRALVAMDHPHLMTEEYNRRFAAVPGAEALRDLSRTERLRVFKEMLGQPDLINEIEH
jgi:hypothetical protein